jgi:anthranilate synthase component II
MILLIDNYDSFTYNLYQALAQLNPDVKVVRNDQITIKEIQAMNVSGIVLSPGPGRPEDAGICIEAVREFYSQVPILGVCLGHQAIGSAFGADIVQSDVILHGKESLIFHRRGPLFRDLPMPFAAGRYHSLIVQNLPDDLIIEAKDGSAHIMAIAHRKYPLFGVQFHPESILTPDGFQILKNFVEICHAARCN